MVTNMRLGGSPLQDRRRLQDEISRLVQSAATPRVSFPAINVYAHQDGIVITATIAASGGGAALGGLLGCRSRWTRTRSKPSCQTVC
jgi:hypothetical protein